MKLILSAVALLASVAGAGAQQIDAGVPTPGELTGKRVLLIVILKSQADTAYLLTGVIHTTADELLVLPDSAPEPVAIPEFDVKHNLFDPAVLPTLVGDDGLVPLAERLADEVTWCIAMFRDEVPDGARPVPGFIGGLATGPAGEILLMQVR